MNKFLDKIYNLGTSNLGLSDLHRVRLFNKMLVISICLCVFTAFNVLLMSVYIPGLLVLALSGVVIFCMKLIQQNHSYLAAVIFTLLAPLNIFVNGYLVQGQIGLEVLLFSIVAIPALIIDIKHYRTVIFLMTYPVILGGILIGCEFYKFGIYSFSPTEIKILIFSNYFVASVLLIKLILIFLNEMALRFDAYKDNQKTIIGQSRLADIAIMTAGVAHEINNPLATMTLCENHISKLLEKENPDRKKINTTLERLGVQIDRIADIIQRMRILSRDSSNDSYEKIEIHKIIDSVVSLSKLKMLNSGVDVHVNLCEDLLWINCRLGQIEQVFFQVINNSEYALLGVEKPVFEMDLFLVNDSVVVKISNNGPKIPPNIHEDIFKPFFTTKPVGTGTGLGLSVALSIIQENNGKMYCESSDEKTSFIFEFPLILKEERVLDELS